MTATVDGKRIRTLRSSRGIRQYQLAEAAGISTYYLRQIEKHDQQASELVLFKIAGALSVDIGELMTEPPRRRATRTK